MELKEKNQLISNELIKNLHNITTNKTLEYETDSGVYRDVTL